MRQRRMSAVCGMVAFTMLCLAGAGAATAQTQPESKTQMREVTDGTGRRVRVPVNVNRIVSLAPNLTEIIYALGAEDKLVGVDNYSHDPFAAKQKPRVGMPQNPSLETIVGLRPDVVLLAAVNRWETVRELERLRIPVYGTDPRSVAGMLKTIEDVGDVIGASAQAHALVAKLQARLDTLKQKLSATPPMPVLFVVWLDPLITVGQQTFIADALRYAGAESAMQTPQDWPQVSLEEVVKLQPEYLVFAVSEGESAGTAGASQQNEVARELRELRAEPGWRGLPAVRAGRVAVVSDEINLPAPGLIDAIEELARELHPQAFAGDSSGANAQPSLAMLAQMRKISSEGLPCGR